MFTTQSTAPSTGEGGGMCWGTKKKPGVAGEVGEVGGRAGQEIVQCDHAMAFGQKTVAHVRPDKPGGAGNNYSQGLTIPSILTKRRWLHMLHSELTAYDRRILAGTGDTCRNSSHLPGPILVALPQRPEGDPRFARHDGFRGIAIGAEDPSISLGSHAAGKGDRAAPTSRPGARLRLLGISGLRAGDGQSHRDAIRRAVPDAGHRFRQLLFRVRGGVGAGGGEKRVRGSASLSSVGC